MGYSELDVSGILKKLYSQKEISYYQRKEGCRT